MGKRTPKRIVNIKEWKSPIPKVFHFIWIGGEQPDYFKKFLDSFRNKCPEFAIKLWGNKELNKTHFPITYPYIKQIKKLQDKDIHEWTGAPTMYKSDDTPYQYSKWAQITDLMRLEIVYREGGFYFDTTFECLKPMYDLLNKNKKFIGCNQIPRFKDVDLLSNSFFGATKGNVILKRLLSKKKLDSIDIRSAIVDYESGPSYLRSGIKLTDSYHILPSVTLYPYVEEFNEGEDMPYRKSSNNKCHGTKKTKKKTLRLKNKKGWLEFPCKKYPNSYALKHWELGKSWLIKHYYTYENSNRQTKNIYDPTVGGYKQTGGVIPACIPCMANPVGLVVGAAGVCAYGIKKGYDCVKGNRSHRKKKSKKSKKSKKDKKSKKGKKTISR